MDIDKNLPGGEASPPGSAGPAPAEGWVRLPGPGGPEHGAPEHGAPEYGDREYGGPQYGGREYGGREYGGPAAESMRVRSDGVRRLRRMSNWTAAALILGTGAATVALAHHSLPGSTTAAGTAATTGIGGTAATNAAGGPQVSHSVATTSGSGVVVTTQTKTVNGRVVVTQVRHTVPYHDN
jgi:hypothetical protein